MDASWRDTAVPNELSLGFWHQHDDDQIRSSHDDQEPKDPSPAELLSKHTGNDRAETGGGVGTAKRSSAFSRRGFNQDPGEERTII